ncbi:MAG TPA: trypsin-like peptidase domain-containing protein [Iamia sp.]|nr:trypsin-like peptidase domain-containing protein [Iamia sp.]
MPPHPPGYRSPAGGPAPASAPRPAPPAGDRGSRLMSALVGGLVGAVVAALVAAGLVLATDDDTPVQESTGSATTEVGSGSDMGVGESLDIQQILDKAQPSVVSINTSVGGQPVAAGSGFVYDEREGFILTNAHVIEGAEEISVTFFDGSATGAELVGAFPEDDVAMLRVEDVENLVPAELGSSDALRVGEDVVAIGNALGLGGKPTVTAGIVSAVNRTIDVYTGLIQTDAAINPGNSGGPLVNSQGQVVGINTAVIPDASNIGLALAIDNILPLIEDLQEGNGVTEDTPFLGVTTQPLTGTDLAPEVLEEYGITEQAGLIVDDVTVGSGADEAGLQRGDVIREIDGEVTDTNQALAEIVRAKAIGDTILVGYDRRGERQDEVEIILGRRGG